MRFGADLVRDDDLGLTDVDLGLVEDDLDFVEVDFEDDGRLKLRLPPPRLPRAKSSLAPAKINIATSATTNTILFRFFMFVSLN